MNRRLLRLQQQRSDIHAMQSARMQQILAESSNPRQTSDLVMDLLYDDRRQQDVNALIDLEMARARLPWWDRIFSR